MSTINNNRYYAILMFDRFILNSEILANFLSFTLSSVDFMSTRVSFHVTCKLKKKCQPKKAKSLSDTLL